MEVGVSGFAIVYVCTDRGQHAEVEVDGGVELTGDPNIVTVDMLVPTLPGSMLELSCPLCPRSPRLRGQRLVKLYDHLLARFRAGERRVVLDISMLPF
jgi:hypothetical protein